MFVPEDIVQHRNGDTYQIVSRCLIEATGVDCYAYHGKNGLVWIMPVTEVENGRFTLLLKEPE